MPPIPRWPPRRGSKLRDVVRDSEAAFDKEDAELHGELLSRKRTADMPLPIAEGACSALPGNAY